LDRAKALTQKLAKVDEPAILNTRGWVRYKSGEYREALPLLQQAVDKVPNSPVMHYHLGMAQYKNGDREAARKNLEFSLQTSEKFVGDADARATLEQINKAG
jgi:tetratricopeptide (TPR) repeat protein